MKKLAKKLTAGAVLGAVALSANAAEFGTTVPMKDKGAATYYVPAHIQGVGNVDLMVDTGSGYMTINEEALKQLSQTNQARYVRDLRGVLANGSQMVVPIYSLTGVNIGGNCYLNDVEAAVFPGKTRFILGLNVLKKAAPFIFSTDPATLVLSNCAPAPIAKADKPAAAKVSAPVAVSNPVVKVGN